MLESVIGRLRGETPFVVDSSLARTHTRLINALHEFFPIHTVGSPQIDVAKENGEIFHRIRNVDATLAEAASRNVLFSETGAPWASSGRVQSLDRYESFAGCFAAAKNRREIAQTSD